LKQIIETEDAKFWRHALEIGSKLFNSEWNDMSKLFKDQMSVLKKIRDCLQNDLLDEQELVETESEQQTATCIEESEHEMDGNDEMSAFEETSLR
jgi:hypothetical protein